MDNSEFLVSFTIQRDLDFTITYNFDGELMDINLKQQYNMRSLRHFANFPFLASIILLYDCSVENYLVKFSCVDLYTYTVHVWCYCKAYMYVD